MMNEDYKKQIKAITQVMEFDHPSKEHIESFLEVQHKKTNPVPFSSFLPEAFLCTAFYMTLFGTFFINVNPYGRASRMRLEQTLNPVWRYSRKLLPFGLLISGVAYFDSINGLF